MSLKEIRISRLKQLQAELGASGPVALARAIGRKTNQTSDLLHGRASFGEKVARSIEEHVGLPPGWLDREVPPGPRSALGHAGALMQRAVGIDITVAPMLLEPTPGAAPAGPPGTPFIGPITLDALWLVSIAAISQPAKLRCLAMPDDLMEPTVSAGDLLLVDTGVGSYTSDGIYVLRANDRLYVRRVRQRLDGSLEVSADSAAVKSADVLTTSQLQPAGRVLWAWRGKRL